MRCKYPARDLNQRLSDSVIRYNGRPVWVAVDGKRLILSNLETRVQENIVNATDPGLDISTIPLGYVNYDNRNKENKVYYCSRKPLRMFKQGIDNRSLKVTSLEDNTNDLNRDFKNNLIFSKYFVNMIIGDYPYKDIMGAVNHLNKSKKEEEELAFNREIALKRTKLQTIHVFFRDELVGWMAPNSNILQVPSNEKGWIVSRYMNGLGWLVN